jgi:hypothetical protein
VNDSLRRRLAIGMFALAAWFAISWPIGLLTSPGRLRRAGELEYLTGDVVVLLPLALLSGVGLLRRQRWAFGTSLLALGALAYDVAHFGVRTAREQESGAVVAAIVVGVAVFLFAVAWLARRVIAARSSADGA